MREPTPAKTFDAIEVLHGSLAWPLVEADVDGRFSVNGLKMLRVDVGKKGGLVQVVRRDGAVCLTRHLARGAVFVWRASGPIDQLLGPLWIQVTAERGGKAVKATVRAVQRPTNLR